MTRPGGPGRPARNDDPKRLVIRIPGSLKRCAIRATSEGRDMGQIATEALENFRRANGRKGKP